MQMQRKDMPADKSEKDAIAPEEVLIRIMAALETLAFLTEKRALKEGIITEDEADYAVDAPEEG